MYINELSLLEHTLSKYDIRESLSTFLELYVAYYMKTRCKELFLYNNYGFEFINCEHKIASWLNDPEVDREEKRLLSSLNQHLKYFSDIDDAELFFYGNECKSGAMVYMNESILLSLATSDKWLENELEGILHYIDSNGEIVSKTIQIPNVSQKNHLHLSSISTILEQVNTELPSDYEELWGKRNIYFPNLIFCESIKDNFEELEKYYISQVIKKLIELEKYFSEWNGSVFEKDRILNVTPESESTLKEYKTEHEFFAPNGEKYLASWHVRFTGIAGRIFFEPYYESKKCLICYVGKKLPNTTYPT